MTIIAAIVGVVLAVVLLIATGLAVFIVRRNIQRKKREDPNYISVMSPPSSPPVLDQSGSLEIADIPEDVSTPGTHSESNFGDEFDNDHAMHGIT